MSHRPLFPRGASLRIAWPTAAVGFLAVLTVVLTQNPAGAAFTASTGNNGNTVSSAASFCIAPGTVILYSVGDSWVDPNNPDAVHQGDSSLYVRSSSSGNYRTWVRFDLPTVPSYCTLTAASLELYDRTPTFGRTIDVYRGVASSTPWQSSTLTWRNQPNYTGAAVGSATPSTSNWQRWDVRAHVQAQYATADGNNGFVLMDRGENSTASTPPQQVYDDLQATGTNTRPQLVLTWG